MAKKALLIGINDYKGNRNLRGCVNDVLNFHFTLRHIYNFQDEEIRVLTDSSATYDNILLKLEWLIQNARSGDLLFFHFSGHGSQIKDNNSDEHNDCFDEILCPHDMDWKSKFISDDKLDEIFRGIPDGTILDVFLDCCHAGNGTSKLGIVASDVIAEDFPNIYRCLLPPGGICSYFDRNEQCPTERSFLKSYKVRNKKNHILWAACAANQTAADAFFNGRFYGAFSYFFNLYLRQSPFISRSKLIKKVQASLTQAGYCQIPQLEMKPEIMHQPILINEPSHVPFYNQDLSRYVA